MAKCSRCGSRPDFQPRVSINSDKILQQLRSSVGFRDQAHITSFLHDAEKDLDDYDTEIAPLEMAISILKRKRARLEGSITLCRSLLSPIRRLPWEILTLVFLFLECGEPSESSDVVTRVKPQAFQVSQVCASWRKLALETPIIWSNLLFDLAGDYHRLQRSDLSGSFIRLCLQRSSQVPLDLTVWNVGEDIDRYVLFDEILRPTSHRWRSLALYNGKANIDLKTLWSQITDLTSMEYLQVDIKTLKTALDASPALRQTPHLRFLHLDLTRPPEISISTASLQAFPWAQLTALRVVWMDSPSQFDVIRGCVHLTKLELRMDYMYTGWDLPSHDGTDLVTLECLNDLQFETDNFDGDELCALLTEVFSRMTTPALKHLTFSCSRPDTDWFFDHKSSRCWPLDVFAEFAQRSGCTLTSLCINSPITTSEFLSLLCLFPDLRELDVREPSTSRTEFEGLVQLLDLGNHHR
ncbi:hypothetical protein K435DRAFT_973564 [Dendrothele bispora CBS 962.96]|uniref:Uncharacterized protein n=1 Tax=Dendrothele bispora (strain CBS 962.96) TaxID=1314807 RepID=A0A4S8KRN0_DENBC|nr:hypothetical protein K435DRAFT_973564 [Dendrothele bispora CBS 962.96]